MRILSRFLTTAAVCIPLLASVVLPSTALEQQPTNSSPDLTEWNMEELMDIETEVTSVSKKSEKLSETTSAVYVITQEDIRRSGATSIAEALRMAPGLQVSSLNVNNWVISARGFSDRFSSKLLVLIDGRSVYSPLYSGVWWDEQDVIMDDIDRIEVIRGPGGTVWGANAMNGVINIITKEAKYTQGMLMTGAAGSEMRSLTQLRYGERIGDKGYYRVYAKSLGWENSALSNGAEAGDRWDQQRAGFRFDGKPSSNDALTLQGDIYRGSVDQMLEAGTMVSPYVTTFNDEVTLFGGNFLGRWTHSASDTSNMALQFYYNKADRLDWRGRERGDTWDVDFQHHFIKSSSHDIIWGAGYRYMTDYIGDGQMIAFDPLSRRTHLASAFIQDDITLYPNKLKITLGSKFEHNSYTGFEYQPSIRMLWIPQKYHTVWAAVSRAIRTPCRFELDSSIDMGIMQQPDGSIANVNLVGNKNLRSENLMAYELGYRIHPKEQISVDVATFYNSYDDVRSFEPDMPYLEPNPTPHIVAPMHMDNLMRAQMYGAELTATWNPNDHWKLAAEYSRIHIHMRPSPTSGDTLMTFYEDICPHNQLNIRSYLDIGSKMELDTALYYTDARQYPTITAPGWNTPSQIRLDLRLGWRPNPDMDVSLGVQNALDQRHSEYGLLVSEYPTEVERNIYARTTWRF